jgi:integrase
LPWEKREVLRLRFAAAKYIFKLNSSFFSVFNNLMKSFAYAYCVRYDADMKENTETQTTKKPVKENASPWQTVAEGLVRYNPSGTYFSYFRSNGKPPERKSLKTTDLATARRLLAQRRIDADKPAPESIGLKEAVTRYLHSISHLSESTQTRAKILCEKLQEKFGDVEISDLKSGDVEKFLSQRIESGRSKSSYNEDLRDSKKLFNLAVRDKFLGENPIADLKALKRDKPNRDTPSEEEFNAILETILTHRTKDDAADCANFVKFMGLAGVGNSEAAALQWKHVDFRGGRIFLYRNKTDKGYEIPMFPRVRELLSELWEASGKLPGSNVFKVSDCYNVIGLACEKLQLPHYDQRSLRRMFIFKCIDANIPLNVIASWQGHADGGATILKNYADKINGQQSKQFAEMVG